MENVVRRHRNLALLVAILFGQVIGLAVQVKRPTESGSTLLIRVWAVRAVTPLQKAIVHSNSWISGVWRNYFYLRGVRQENRELREQIQQLRLERVRMAEDASQARRLQALLGFREQFISQTLPAQVISTTGTEFSRGIFIDKGSADGLRPDMPVITPDGIIGKIYRVFPSSSLVLLINDPSSGAGVILEKSRLQGILKGASNGDVLLNNIMSDEKVEPGEKVLTSGGDRIFPKGLPVGVVASVAPGADLFLRIRVRPFARLEKLEEVLVITKVEERAPSVEDLTGPIRAADILAARLPSVPKPNTPGNGTAGPSVPPPTRNLPPPTRNLPPPTAGLPPVAAPTTPIVKPARKPAGGMAQKESVAEAPLATPPANTGASSNDATAPPAGDSTLVPQPKGLTQAPAKEQAQ